MEYNELMQGFAAKLGVAELEMHEGATVLEMDNMTVGFVHDPVEDAVMVVVEIGYPPPDADGPFGGVMLKANYLFGGTGGATLCQNPETSAYAVMRSWPLQLLDVDTFAAAVEKLVNTAETWKDSLSGSAEAEEAKEEMDEEFENALSHGQLPGSLSSNGFLQV